MKSVKEIFNETKRTRKRKKNIYKKKKQASSSIYLREGN